MLAFYDVNEDYVNFLKTIDPKIPNIKYDTNNKFVCGVVLDVNGIQYYAPVSHMNKKQQTNFLIYQGDRAIASVRFSFMFPAPMEVLTKKDFKAISQYDSQYANLLATELSYCSSHSEALMKKALSVYKIGCNKDHVLNKVCCDFPALEQGYMNYK